MKYSLIAALIGATTAKDLFLNDAIDLLAVTKDKFDAGFCQPVVNKVLYDMNDFDKNIRDYSKNMPAKVDVDLDTYKVYAGDDTITSVNFLFKTCVIPY